MAVSTKKGAILRFVNESAAGALRTVPNQARSRHTVETILDAAADLLREGGPDALTTSALSQRSGLRVRNVYRYFRDRHAVMVTLAERVNGRIETAIADVAALADPDRSLRHAVDELVDRVIEAATSDPAAAQIRAAMRTSPQLQALERESDFRIAQLLAQFLQARGSRTRRARLETGLFVLATSLGAVLDRAAVADEDDGVALVREAKRMAYAYFQTLV